MTSDTSDAFAAGRKSIAGWMRRAFVRIAKVVWRLVSWSPSEVSLAFPGTTSVRFLSFENLLRFTGTGNVTTKALCMLI